MANDVLLFNPAAASTEELRTVFAARHKLLDTLADELREQHASPTIQHYLIVGPRGIGKTHITEILARQLATDETHPWRTVRMPEESYSYRGLDELLAAIVERDTETERAWDAPVPPIETSLDTLAARQQDTSRPLLVVLENLPRVLQRTLRGKQEISRLRAILMCSPPFTLMATATSYFEANAREDRPLYDFFRVIPLRDLTGDEIEELVRRRAAWDDLGSARLEVAVRRARAISHLSGGNPRLVLALYSVVRAGVTQDIQRQFLGLLDRVTTYYQARLDDLSQQQAMLLTRLALAPGPVAAAKLARLSGLPTSHTTAVLKVLQDERMVKRVPRPGKKRHAYEVNDRLFRIWLEMRESRGAQRRLRFLIDFYRMAYTAAELQATLDRWCASLGEQLHRGARQRLGDSLLTIDYGSDALCLDRDGRATAILDNLFAPGNVLDSDALRKAIEDSRAEHPETSAALRVALATALLDEDLEEAQWQLAEARKTVPSWEMIALTSYWVEFSLGRFRAAYEAALEFPEIPQALILRLSAGFLAGEIGDIDEVRRLLRSTADEQRTAWLSLAKSLPSNVDVLERLYRFADLLCRFYPKEPATFYKAMNLAMERGQWSDLARYARIVLSSEDGEISELWRHWAGRMLAIAAAGLGDVEAYAMGSSYFLPQGDERWHYFQGVAIAMRQTEEPVIHRATLVRLLENHALAAEEIEQLYEGLWIVCEDVTLEWTAQVVALFAELTGVEPEPWQSFRKYVESDQNPEFLRTLHPEVREAVELILARHGAKRDGSPEATP